MHSLSSESMRREAERIRTAYARRQKHDSRYSWFNSSYLFMMQEREQRLLTLLQPHCCALPKSRILEIGCGTGYWLREFIKWGAQPENIAGVDLLSERTVEARKLCPEMVQIHDGNAAELPFADQTFDVVLQSTVFTSVLDPNVKQQIAAEMLRVVKSDGLLLWYDYYVNNPWNADVRGVNRQELAQLFPGCSMRLQRITLAPPLVRILAPYSWLACYLLSKVPWLCTHYLGVIRKRL